MATVVSDPTRWLADQWENHAGYPSAVLSGIVPDRAHLDDGGYHVSLADLAAYGNLGDYSSSRPLDKAPPVTTAGRVFAAAVDVSMSKADMVRLYGRAMAVFNNPADPRRKYINAINVWDGNPNHAPRRLNFQTGSNTTASKDHTWHSHGDQPRAYVDVHRNAAEAWQAARAFVSMVKGDSVADYLTNASGGTDVNVSDNDAKHLIWRAYALTFGLTVVPEGPAKGEPVVPNVKLLAIESAVGQLVAEATADKARDAAQLAAIQALADALKAGGGSVETAAIVAAVNAAADKVRADVIALQEKLAAAERERDELHRRLAEALDTAA